MKLKSYFAATVEAAMNMARVELGSDAMLVTSKRAGIEARRLGEYEVVFATGHGNSRLAAADLETHSGPPAAPPQPANGDRLSDEVAGLKHEMERLASALARSSAGMARIAASSTLAEVFSRLVDAELDAGLAQDIVWRLTSKFDNAGAITAAACAQMVAAELSQEVNVDSRMPASGAKNAIALVGPPGCGKTTTLVKLAVLYGLGTRRSSQVLSLDAHRVAASEQLRSYAAITGIGFQAIETPRALAQALEEHRMKDLIFIDTPGFGRNELEEAADLAAALGSHPQIETFLVLGASMKPADMKRMARQYEIFSPSRLIFTRLDETETLGPLLNLSVKMSKPISFLSRGQQIPEDLEPAGREVLVQAIVKDMQFSGEELSVTAAA